MIDKKIQNFEKKIIQFNEHKLAKVYDAVAVSSDEFDRAFLRAERELTSLFKKLTKLGDKFSNNELAGVHKLLEENKAALQRIHDENIGESKDAPNTENIEETSAVNKIPHDKHSSNSAEVPSSSKSEELNKDIKKFARDLKNFETFQLKNVRDLNFQKRLNSYLKEIYEVDKRFKKIEDKYHQLESKYEPVQLEEVAETYFAYQDELQQHKENAKQIQEKESYWESRAKAFYLIAQYFSSAADQHIGSEAIIKAALHQGFTYTFDDTQTLLEIEGYDHNLNIRNGKEAYNKSKDNLYNENYIESYYLYLDQLIAYDSDKEKTLSTIYEAVSIIKDSMFPDFESLNDILFYINKLKDQRVQLQQKALNEYVVSDFHANNLNQVFFTNQELKAVSALIGDDMKSEFLPGESIRCIAFLDNSFKNIYGKNNRPTFELVNDVRPMITEEFTQEDLDKAYIDFKLVTNGKNYKFPNTARWSSVEKTMQFFTQLPPRNKQLEVKIGANAYIDGTFPAAELIGKFKIDGGDLEGIEILKQHLKIVQNKSLESEPIPESRMINVDYETEILALFNSLGWKENFMRIIITSEDFFAIKNAEGIVIARGLYISSLSESSEGCFKQNFTVAQDPIGELWSKFRLHSRGDKSQISCDKIK